MAAVRSCLRVRGIVARTAWVLVGLSCLVSFIFIALAGYFAEERAERYAARRLGELLDTVESTASIACFTEDHALAEEVAKGLLKNSEVLGVVIRGGERELVRSYRGAAASWGGVEGARRKRDVYSPFKPQQKVGEIIVDPNPAEVSSLVSQELGFMGGLLGMQMLVLILAAVSGTLLFVVQPIKYMSDRLHVMDASAGERLQIPFAHCDTEIGQLVGDINALADRLVKTLDDERCLRMEREIGERKYQAIFDNAETGIFIASGDSLVRSHNPALARMLELEAGRTGHWRLVDLPWRVPGRIPALIGESIENNCVRSEDLELLMADQSTHWFNVVLSPLADGAVQGVMNDVTARKREESRARQMMLVDPLTGAWNRLGLEERLGEELRGQGREGLALLLVDIDGFARVRNAFGVQGGDELLRHILARLQGSTKVTDSVAHLEGSEFALVLPRVGREKDARSIVERLLGVLAASFEMQGAPIQLAASIGIALCPEDGKDVATLLHHAELALAQAQAEGGSRYRFFEPSMEEAAARRRDLETDMRLAIRRQQFQLYYQPIVDLEENRLAGAEALIRWQHHDQGLVAPDAFIPLAEETGFIRDIGLWALEEVCRQLAEWRRQGCDLYVSLNVSARQIPDGLPAAALKAAIARHGIDPGQLVLEITEGALMSDMDKALGWLNTVRELGLKVYLDDFGTGYSSLSYLKRFPVDTVKVDRSFVRDMGEDTSDRALVEAVVAMARSLGLRVVAEGVETASQLELLRRMACRSAQGYYFSRPVPSGDFPGAAERIKALLAA